jgi:two-component system sensor histidine kinase/response regulator
MNTKNDLPKKPLIVAIDDEKINLELLGFIMEKSGYGFLGIHHSKDALAILEKNKPEIILLDVVMPEMDGFQLCVQLKNNQKLKDIPIIFLTGKNSIENKIKGLKMGGVYYVTKPFNENELSARIQTHVALAASKIKIKNQALALQKDNALKDRMLSIIGHDLRSPLSALKMHLDFILRGIIQTDSPDFVNNTIQNLNATTDEALNLLDNLLNWARLESGVLSVIPETLEVLKIADQIKRLNGMALENKAITLSIAIPEDAKIQADLNLVKTVFRNLVSNAIKFTPKNGEITISALLTRNFWEVSITDTGIGIANEDLLKIKNANSFFTKEGTEKESGTGLGISICQNFIKKIGGKFIIESELGIGSTFKFTLPAVLD